MAQKLVAVANATGSSANLTNTEASKDDGPIPANAVTHTGGADNDFLTIPDCSDSRYFADHHISISAEDGSWTVSLWNNDDQDHVFQWSPDASYSGGHTAAGSDLWDSVAILIEVNSGGPVVYCSQWT